MRVIVIPLFLLGCYISTVSCESYSRSLEYSSKGGINSILPSGESDEAFDLTDPDPIDKKADRYAFGLGRRSSNSYPAKRLPVYNFGLGKRARPYAFGLGKRSDTSDNDYLENFESSSYESYPLFFPIAVKVDPIDIKRGRPYSFGLGKRQNKNNDGVERRSSGTGSRYNFGLGRR